MSIHTATWSVAASVPGYVPSGSARSSTSRNSTYRPLSGWLSQNVPFTFGTTYGGSGNGRGHELEDQTAVRSPFRMVLGVMIGKHPDCQGCVVGLSP